MKSILICLLASFSLLASAGGAETNADEPVLLYEQGMNLLLGRNGAARDPQAAARCFERLARAGWAVAQNRLGELYEQGLGVPRDLDRAREWFRRAAEQGHPLARANLTRLQNQVAFLQN